MSVTSNYAVGHNMAGYLPESDVIVVSEWSEAVEILAEEMRTYADADDDSAYDSLNQNVLADWITHDYPLDENGEPVYGDDTPSMRATVDSIIADEWDYVKNRPTPSDTVFHVMDNDDRMIAFWITRTDEPVSDGFDSDEEDDEFPDTCLNSIDGHWYVITYGRAPYQIHAVDCSTCHPEG